MGWRGRRILVIAILCGKGAMAEAPSTPPALVADLGRYFFKSPADEVASRTEITYALDRVAAFKGQLTSAKQLLGMLQADDALEVVLAHHENYLHLRCSIDRHDASCGAEDTLQSDVEARSGFVETELIALPEDRLQTFLSQDSALQKYRFALSDLRRHRAHELPEAEQSVLDRFNSSISGWQYDLYDQAVARIPFGSVQTPAGPLDVIRQRNLIAVNPDPRVREEGFKRRLAGFASQRDLLAFALTHLVQAKDLLAKQRGYPDAPARKYQSLYCKPEDTRHLLEAMALHGDVAKRFESLRSREIERDTHAPANAWDMSAPAMGLVLPVTSLAGARGLFHDAFAGLGPGYQAEFDALLDPANGRADILPGGGPRRYGSGFSVGGAGGTGILFYGRYDGTFKDLSVIAHEGGHAVHRQLMTEGGVSPSYDHGPNFLFESFAAFNELVLADALAERAPSPDLKRYYLERWMSIKGLDAFYGAQDALLEQAIYDGVAAGTIKGADELDGLTLRTDGQFSNFPARTPELRARWAILSLMLEDPLYDVNYVYGGLLALKYYNLYSTRQAWFVPRYLALLRNGFDRAPDELLRKFLEIDLSGPALLTDDLALLNRRMDQLEASVAP